VKKLVTTFGVLLAARATAQPVTTPEPAPPPPPLAQIRDEKQLMEALAQITNDPAVPVTDPARKQQAAALMAEGVKQLHANGYDQALANFLEAYTQYPSPKILLNVATTLLEMGRPADAANTYQRYLSDPASGTDRIAEVKELLIRLDEQLTILTVRVTPRGSEVSIDAGPFIPVGSTLVTRVRPGLHLARIRNTAGAMQEMTINGFEGENKEVQLAIAEPPPPPPPKNPPVIDPKQPPEVVKEPPKAPPEHQDGWLITGQYSSDGTGNKRGVLTRTAGEPVAAVTPAFDILDDGSISLPGNKREKISSGAVGIVRIDGQGRGFAGGVGLAVSWGRVEADVMYLRSQLNGGYLGMRFRVFENRIPGAVMDTFETKLAIGARVAGGLELYINGHLSVQADLGYEHFWGVKNTNPKFDADLFVPTIGVIGRM
jgi:hypothetical protein